MARDSMGLFVSEAPSIMTFPSIETDENLARGMPPAEARAAAVRKFGNPTRVREDVYVMNSIGPIDSLWQDVRYALRILKREKAFALAAVLSLTLGIGANAAIFQLLDAVRLCTLPVSDAQELIEVRIGGRVSRTGSFQGRRPNKAERVSGRDGRVESAREFSGAVDGASGHDGTRAFDCLCQSCEPLAGTGQRARA